MKKSFTLFSVIILIFVFSMLIVKIYETKSINSINIVNQYEYIQGKNHLLFLEEYINSIDELSKVNKIVIENDKYEILAYINENEKSYEIEMIINLIEGNIRLHKVIYKNK